MIKFLIHHLLDSIKVYELTQLAAVQQNFSIKKLHDKQNELWPDKHHTHLLWSFLRENLSSFLLGNIHLGKVVWNEEVAGSDTYESGSSCAHFVGNERNMGEGEGGEVNL